MRPPTAITQTTAIDRIAGIKLSKGTGRARPPRRVACVISVALAALALAGCGGSKRAATTHAHVASVPSTQAATTTTAAGHPAAKRSKPRARRRPAARAHAPAHHAPAHATTATTSTTTTTPAKTAASTHSSPTPKTQPGVTVEVRSSSLGMILVGPTGRTLYLFAKDTGTSSTCYGSCASVWPPLTTTGPPRAGPGVNASLLGTTRRSDGTIEVTYGGHPLYYFAGDTAPGQMTGQALSQFGAPWYVVSPSGSAITSRASS